MKAIFGVTRELVIWLALVSQQGWQHNGQYG